MGTAYRTLSQSEDGSPIPKHASVDSSDSPVHRNDRSASYQPLSLEFDPLGDLSNFEAQPLSDPALAPSSTSTGTSYDMLESEDEAGVRTGQLNPRTDEPRVNAHVNGGSRERPGLQPQPQHPSGSPPPYAAEAFDLPRALSPEPMFRTVSNEGSANLRHPAPDLQSLQGAYVGNVQRLERSAERLSMTSDFGEELRKIRSVQRRAESRRSSVRERAIEEELPAPPSRANRETSSNSFSHSAAGNNSTTRSREYSPAAYITSPRHSIRSGSFSNRGGSSSRGSRSYQFPESERDSRPPYSFVNSSFSVISPPPAASSHHTLQSNLPDNPNSIPLSTIADDLNMHIHHGTNMNPTLIKTADLPERPGTSASTDTYQQANQLFYDFDGTHYTPSTQEHPVGPLPSPGSYRDPSTHQVSTVRVTSYAEPGTGENMVYYPAPVPMMLNLPQRLSKLPSPTQREKRRTEILDSVPREARKSAAWLPELLEGEDDTAQVEEQSAGKPCGPRHAVKNAANIPPQLRASTFFDQPTVQQDVELKGDSAVATLDSILDASARAPVNAFTDHPLAGHAAGGVYGKESSKRVTSDPLYNKGNARKSRSSLNILGGRRRKSKIDVSQQNAADTPRSSGERTVSRLGPYTDKYLKNDGIEEGDEDLESTPLGQFGDADDRDHVPENEMGGEADSGGEDMDEDRSQSEDAESHAGDFRGAPTTLLAELQLRKEEQRHRNKTAATAFPNGMHSTLLELDAVAQVQKNSRRHKRVALAWEDPHAPNQASDNEDDEEVPLGMLYPSQANQRDNQRRRTNLDFPMGLMEKRDMEDNEPLSRRRNRLKGGPSPGPERTAEDKGDTTYQLGPPFLDDEQGNNSLDEEGETLAQRLRRLKGEPTKMRMVSDDFASDLLSQFGGDLGKKGAASPKEQEKDEETLGQRRRRLQAEREAQTLKESRKDNLATHHRPQITKRHSMADILQAHPAAGGRPYSQLPGPGGSGQLLMAGHTANGLPHQHVQPQGPIAEQRHTMGYGSNIMVSNPMMYSQFNPNLGMTIPYPNGMGPGINPMMQFNQPAASLDSRQRDMIDRWRQSVLP
ncbi:MAG: hypothetical protein M1837_004420 [Sclerophora amabilis]|nr:MAG: hypothetical protein M1837_004420 [Sclerophora amabilis]